MFSKGTTNFKLCLSSTNLILMVDLIGKSLSVFKR
jgi:hypothetical protein